MPGIESGFEHQATPSNSEKSKIEVSPTKVRHLPEVQPVDAAALLIMDKVNGIQSRYLEQITSAQENGASDTEINQLRKQEIDEILSLDAAKERGLYESLEMAVLLSSKDIEEANRILIAIDSNKKEEYLVSSKDVAIFRRHKIAGTNLEYISVSRPFERYVPNDPDSPWNVVSISLLHDLNNDKTLSLGERTPCGITMHHTLSGVYAPEQHQVKGPEIQEVEHIGTWLHEVGHAWDNLYNAKEYTILKPAQLEEAQSDTPIITGKTATVKKERNAWAWAIRESRRLKELGFIIDDEIEGILISDAAYCLATYESGNAKYEGPLFTSTLRYFERKLDNLRLITGVLSELIIEKQTLQFRVPIAEGSAQVELNCKVTGDSLQIAVEVPSGDKVVKKIIYTVGDRSITKIGWDRQNKSMSSIDHVEALNMETLKSMAKAQDQVDQGEKFIAKLEDANAMCNEIDNLRNIVGFVKEYYEKQSEQRAAT